MKDYKDTLNLPQTAFPMKADLPAREPELLAQWEKMGLYEKIREARQGAEIYLLHSTRIAVEHRLGWAFFCDDKIRVDSGEAHTACIVVA